MLSSHLLSRTKERLQIFKDVVGLTFPLIAVLKKWLNKFSAYKKLASITVGYLDMETMNIVDTQMYIDGYQVKLVSDTSYGSLWEVSFTLKEF